MARPPTPEQWVEMRPIITKWYLREQRTARWIASEVKRTRNLNVTTKMLRDRFRTWKLKPKYNKLKNQSAEQPEEDEEQANALRVREPANAYPIRGNVARGGLFSGLTIADDHNANFSDIATESRGYNRELPAPYPDTATARHSIEPLLPNYDATASGTLHSVRSFANQPASLPNGQLKNDTNGGDPYYTTVFDDSFATSVLQSDFWPAVNPSVDVNGYGAFWSFYQGPMPYYYRLSDNSEAFTYIPPEEDSSGTEEIVDIRQSRPPNTPEDDRPLTKTLKAIQNYFRNLTDIIKQRYLQPQDLDKEPALEVQRVAANAHQAVVSERFFSHKTFQELSNLQSRTEDVLPQLNVDFMHPRVLTVLLRLIVDSTSDVDGTVREGGELSILSMVKRLFERVSTMNLFHWHPVALLCSMPEDKDQTNQLLHYQMELAKVELYDQIRPHDPVFVTWEEIYSARVLASLGRTDKAKELLDGVFLNFSMSPSDEELFTHADACRTLGYTKLNAGQPESAVDLLTQALEEFHHSGYGNTENVLYTHLALSWAYRRMNRLYECEQSLWEVLTLWKSEATLGRNQSAVKFIRDLDEILAEQKKFNERDELRKDYHTYFEEVKGG